MNDGSIIGCTIVGIDDDSTFGRIVGVTEGVAEGSGGLKTSSSNVSKSSVNTTGDTDGRLEGLCAEGTCDGGEDASPCTELVGNTDG